MILYQDIGEAGGTVMIPALVLMDKTLSALAFRLYVMSQARGQLDIEVVSWADVLGESPYRVQTALDELTKRGLFSVDGRIPGPRAVYTWEDVYGVFPELREVHADVGQPEARPA